MFTVYWTAEGSPHSASYPIEKMKESLLFMEALRLQQREGKDVGFIAMASENPQSVGHPGVAETGSDYNWTKRRTARNGTLTT